MNKQRLSSDNQILGKIEIDIELSDKEHVRPGHLDLQLNAESVYGHYQLSHNIAAMDKLLRDFRCNKCCSKKNPFDRCEMCKCVFTCNAILNLKGTFLYYQKKYLEACHEFKKVLKTDDKNQNALCNLCYVYRKLGESEEAEKYNQLYIECASNTKSEVIFLGEQGFAVLFDCHTTTNELERNSRSVKMFEKCLKLLTNLPMHEKDPDLEIARLELELWYAKSLQRMSNVCSAENNLKDLTTCYKDGMKTLKGLIQRAEGHTHITAIAYTYLGCFLSKRCGAVEQLNMYQELKKEFKHSSHCFEKALGNQKNTEVLVRYALSLKYRDITKAIELINEALKIDSSHDRNWFAWCVSSELHFLKYKKSKDPKTLDIAIKHGEIAARKNQTADLFATLGKAYHHKARFCPREKERHNIYLKALENFLHALQHLDGDKRGVVHIAHGNCLFDMGLLRPAMESFKQAVELGLDAKINIRFSYTLMMKCYMKMLEKETCVKEKQRILETIVYWLSVGDTEKNFINQKLVKEKPSKKDQNTSQDANVPSKENTHPSKPLRQLSRTISSSDDFRNNRELCDQREKSSDWQTISPTAFLILIKFLLKETNEKQEKIVQWCLSSGNLKDHPQTVLDILLHIVPLRNKNLIEDCLKLLSDYPYIHSSKRDEEKVCKVNQNVCYINESLRSWYLDKISECLIEVQCKRCQKSKRRKYDCGHELDHVALYFMIAKYCPYFAADIADNLLTRNVRFAKSLLEAFQKDHLADQHIMVYISDLHYQACWLLSDRKSVHQNLKHDSAYKRGHHPQFHTTLNRCLSQTKDREDALHQLARISSTDEDSHLKLVKRQHKYDKIYLNYCRVEHGPTFATGSTQKRLPKRRFPKYEYDFFVVNSDKDNDWVRFELLPTLEERYGFKGCFKTRDFELGKSIIGEFEEKVEQSSKVLLVLTENFKTDQHCRFQMHSALIKKLFIGTGKVIPMVTLSGAEKVIREKVIPEELQHIVCFFVNKFEWERLVRAIEAE